MSYLLSLIAATTISRRRFGVHDVAIVAACGTGRLTAGRSTRCVCITRRRFVQLLTECLAGRHELLGGVLDRVDITAGEGGLEVGERLFYCFALVLGDLLALLAQHLLGLVHE